MTDEKAREIVARWQCYGGVAVKTPSRDLADADREALVQAIAAALRARETQTVGALEAAKWLAESEHAMTCRIVGNGCNCGAWAQRNEARAEFYRRLRALAPLTPGGERQGEIP